VAPVIVYGGAPILLATDYVTEPLSSHLKREEESKGEGKEHSYTTAHINKTVLELFLKNAFLPHDKRKIQRVHPLDQG
jgi:hypothetical protein